MAKPKQRPVERKLLFKSGNLRVEDVRGLGEVEVMIDFVDCIGVPTAAGEWLTYAASRQLARKLLGMPRFASTPTSCQRPRTATTRRQKRRT